MVTVMPYERHVHYRRGKLEGILEPGTHRFWGRGHTFVPVDLRISLFEVRPQEVLTSDGVGVKVSASARLRVVDPVAFEEFTADPHGLVYDAVKTWIRETVRTLSFDEVVAGLAAAPVPPAVATAARDAGLELSDFGVRDVIVPHDVRRAADDLAAARQQSQVALEKARSEVAVLRALANSAKILEDHPTLAALRLAETASSHGGTVIIERPAS